jgi:type I restriction enzyme S subunit
MSEWPSFSVAELQADGVLLVEDGNHGEYRPRPHEFVEGGTAFIRAADLSDGQVRFAAASGVNEVALQRIRKGVGKPGDVVFSHKGTVGKLARVPLGAPPFVCSPQTTFWRVLDESRLRRDYLFAYMRSRPFIDQWWVRKGETDMADYVSLTAQRQLRVVLPPVEVQRRIAEPLAALDDLIENHRRRVEVLEELAREIYREWFVRFHYPGHEDVPLVDSPLGPIPETWAVGTVGDVLTLQRGFDLPTKSRSQGFVPIVSASGVGGSHDQAKVHGPGVVTGRSGTVGPVFYVPVDHWPLNTTLWVKEFRRSSALHAWLFLDELDLGRFAGGAAVPTLNRNVVHSEPVAVAPIELVQRFDDAAQPLAKLADSHRHASGALATIRDLVLPRLVTGQIDVSQLDLDALTEAASA